MKRFSRAAFTLVELLVVIAIIGILIGILLPAVQQVREAARRSACCNKVMQMSLAILNFESTFQRLPKNSYGTVGWNLWENMSASYKILPFLEQENLYNEFILDGSVSFGEIKNGPMNQSLPVFLCPSNGSPGPTMSDDYWGGPGSHYGWCSGSTPHTAWYSADTMNGLIHLERENTLAMCTDGLSNTVLVSELISGTGDNSQATFPYDVFYLGSNIMFDALADKAFPTLAETEAIGIAAESPAGVLGNNGSLWAWYSPGHSMFNSSVPPNWRYPSTGGDCCPGGAQDWYYGFIPARSFHFGGVNAGLGDGSVHFVQDSIDQLTWQQVSHSNDGATATIFK